MMHSGFWLGIELKDFLFKNLNVSTLPGFLGLCLGVASFSFLFEALRAWRASLIYKTFTESPPNQLRLDARLAVSVCSDNWPVHLLQTALHGIQVAMGFFMMLIVMSYNTYLALCVLFGAAVGHVVFFLVRSSPSSEELVKSEYDTLGNATAEASPARSESPILGSRYQTEAVIEELHAST